MAHELAGKYKNRKTEIKGRLKEFKEVWSRSDKKIFTELCFCICTPQSKAVYCDKAVRGLEKSGKLFDGKVDEVREGLVAVRFPNNKARFIVESRGVFLEKGKIRIKDKLDTKNIKDTRDWLVKNVKGIGYKEASHFLRNIGFGRHLAILDVHILKNMLRYGIIKEGPKTISRKTYIDLEEKLEKFADKIGIPMDELDLVFWSEQTGMVFK